MRQDMKLVVQDRGLRGIALLECRVAERLPHIHDRQADFAAVLRAQPGEELVEARFGAIVATKPDGPAPLQVADHDAILVPLGNGDLVDADDLGAGVPACRSCSRMYCLSSSLTACQSRYSSSATSLMGVCR